MIPEILSALKNESLSRLAIGLIDIIVVAGLIYRILLVLKGTRAIQMALGIVLILVTYVVSSWIGLVTLVSLFSYLLPSLIIIIVVVFQNDIRRALTRIGSSPLFGGWGRALETRVVDEVVAATTELARHRTGALITFEQDANLDEFVVGQGIVIDSAVTKELLVTLFIPESINKLHDGAVIIRNLRVAKAGVFFPMPEAKHIDSAYGSRHRAAIGITEETDAVVIAVSEERGTISFCFNGNIVADLDGEVLRKTLLRIFGRSQKPSVEEKKPDDVDSMNRVAIPAPPASRLGRVVASSTKPPIKLPSISETLRSTHEIAHPRVSSPTLVSAPVLAAASDSTLTAPKSPRTSLHQPSLAPTRPSSRPADPQSTLTRPSSVAPAMSTASAMMGETTDESESLVAARTSASVAPMARTTTSSHPPAVTEAGT